MKWEVKSKAEEEFVKKFPEINQVVLQLLYNRELTNQEAIDAFMTLDYSQDQHDPFLFKDMEKACERIEKAIKDGEKITVHGDYDADGVCASTVMMKTLQKLGAKDPGIYIPHRESEGYGLNSNTVDYFVEQGVNLVITVDCGVANKDEISLAKEKGIDVIVTDHHAQPLEMPTDAYAIINPSIEEDNYPTTDLSGAAVAFKVAQALIKRNDLGEAFEKWLLDIVAVSMVTDCIRLIGESRLFTYYGLKVLRKTLRPGIKALVVSARREMADLDTQAIGFQLGPRLNAAGRMDHANTAYELLMTEDENQAQELAMKIEGNNKERQKLSEKIYKQVDAQIQDQLDEKFFIVKGEEWPLGLVGLVAGKVADKHYRPTLILTANEDEVSGSGRSIPEFNMMEALQEIEESFDRYGGHSQACGFTLKEGMDVKEVQEKLKVIVNRELEGKDLTKKLPIEAEIELSKVDWDLVGELEKFRPYGEANPEPLFVSRKLKVADLKLVGKKADHLKMMVVDDEGKNKKTIGFRLAVKAEGLKIGDEIDLVYEIGINEWNGSKEIQLKIIDFKKHENN